MIRAGVLLALLTFASPVWADTIALAKGDVACVGYDASDQTCLSKGTVISDDGTRLSYSKETLLGDYEPPLALTMFSQIDAKESRYCLVSGSIRSVIFPAMTPQAQILNFNANRSNEELSRLGYCTEYRRCGDLIISNAWIGGLRDPRGDTSLRLFRAGDPVIEDLSVRPASFDDLNRPVDTECPLVS